MTDARGVAPADRLYQLLPAFHRQRDLEQGGPLRALLTVIAEQVQVVEADIGRLYDNLFIETCEDWVVTYLGDLVGARATGPGASIPRRRVANTIRARRRKGALALLEELALDVAAWPSRAVELYRLLAFTQHLAHRRPDRGRLVDLRRPARLAHVGGPFDEEAHLPDFRADGSPLFDLSTVALFVWRLRAYSVTHTPASCLERIASNCFTFSILGNDTPLFNRPLPEPDPTHIAGALNVPAPIRRSDFAEHLTINAQSVSRASAPYYGGGPESEKKLDEQPAQSLLIWAPGFPTKNAPQPLPRDLIVPADLHAWHYRPPRGLVAVDPERGRIVFPPGQAPKRGVWVSYHYGFAGDIGGGEYDRPLSAPPVERPYRVGRGEEFDTINKALAHWAAQQPKPAAAIVEIMDSAVYTEPLAVTLGPGESLQIRAANRARPVLRLLDYLADRPDAFSVTGQRGSRFVLDGVLVVGCGLRVYGHDSRDDDEPIGAGGDLCDITIRHCTLVPGWTLECDCSPCEPNEPSLQLINTRATVRIERSILGSITVVADEVLTDPVSIEICASIVDATDSGRVAVGSSDGRSAFAALTVRETTVFGRTEVHAIDLGENSIFQGTVRVARRQRGCLRFCYLPPDSRAPRRFECQPQLVEHAVAVALTDPDEQVVEQQRERERVRPRFTSTRFGTPAYAQLAHSGPDEIARGAEDEAELGAFHHLRQPQRIDDLRATVDEHTPAGVEVALFFVT